MQNPNMRSSAEANEGRAGEDVYHRNYNDMIGGDTLSESYDPSNGARARSEFNCHPDLATSNYASNEQPHVANSGHGHSAKIVQSMQERNNQMRGDARILN